MYLQEREEVAYFMTRLYNMGLTTTSGGNISMLVEGHIIITPAALDKGRLTAEQIVVISPKGENLTPQVRPTSEKDMHQAIYKANSHVKSIVHAHPVTASAFACSNKTINTKLMAEPYALLGEPVRAEYATMGTVQLAENVAKVSVGNRAIIMDNHGVLTMGATVLQAFDRLEVLENAAKTTLINEILKDTNQIDDANLKVLAAFGL